MRDVDPCLYRESNHEDAEGAAMTAARLEDWIAGFFFAVLIILLFWFF